MTFEWLDASFEDEPGRQEFHLVAEPVVREWRRVSRPICGATTAKARATIEVVEGDRVRIFVTNRLPEHQHPLARAALLPSGMDGVARLTNLQSSQEKRSCTSSWQGVQELSCTTPMRMK